MKSALLLLACGLTHAARVLHKLAGKDSAQKTSDAVSFWLVYTRGF
jgi:hypothetical protein